MAGRYFRSGQLIAAGMEVIIILSNAIDSGKSALRNKSAPVAVDRRGKIDNHRVLRGLFPSSMR